MRAERGPRPVGSADADVSVSHPNFWSDVFRAERRCHVCSARNAPARNGSSRRASPVAADARLAPRRTSSEAVTVGALSANLPTGNDLARAAVRQPGARQFERGGARHRGCATTRWGALRAGLASLADLRIAEATSAPRVRRCVQGRGIVGGDRRLEGDERHPRPHRNRAGENLAPRLTCRTA